MHKHTFCYAIFLISVSMFVTSAQAGLPDGHPVTNPSPTMDTLYVTDLAAVPRMALIVDGYGNLGLSGAGTLNMDFYNYGDCDIGDPDPYPGDASIYLYDGSKIICWYDAAGDSVACNYSMYDRHGTTGGLQPITSSIVTEPPDWLTTSDSVVPGQMYLTETVARDSTILVQELTVAPQTAQPRFVLQATRFSNISNGTASDLVIGEAIDWDIPSDSAFDNNSGFDVVMKMIYQQGCEFDEDTECQDNDLRYGATAFVGQYNKGLWEDHPWNAYTMDIATQVYPTDDFVNDSLWQYMRLISGYSASGAAETDLFSMITFAASYSLEPDEDLIVLTLLASSNDGYNSLATALDAGWEFYHRCFAIGDTGCCNILCDINDDGVAVDIADLVYLVSYMFQNGSAPPCLDAADVNRDGEVNIDDLIAIINCMFWFWPECPCGDPC